MGKILLEDMEFYAYHGCFEEERVIGGRFIVNFEFDVDTGNSELNDDITKTVNYQEVYNLIEEQMKIKSYLIENLARRIIDAVFREYNMLNYAKVKVSKLNPPIGGKMKAVSIIVERHAAGK